jgi:hypothetical protein
LKITDRKHLERTTCRRILVDLAQQDDAARSANVRALCPCEGKWDVSLWKVIHAACNDESPLVRMEALHVIEDAYRDGFSSGRGMTIFFAARNDPAPDVRRFVEDNLRVLPSV